MDLAIGDDEDANKASCSIVSSLFDLAINQPKEMFTCCSPDMLVEARKKCCDFEDAVDIVMHQINQLKKPCLIDARFPKKLSMDNFFLAIMSLCLHSFLLSRMAELDLFISGLRPLHAVIMKHPTKVECLFVTGNEKPPTADKLLSLMVFEGVWLNIINSLTSVLKHHKVIFFILIIIKFFFTL